MNKVRYVFPVVLAILATVALPFRAGAVFPNPFTDGTTFELTMPQGGEIRISVYDIAGKHVRTLYEGFHAAGVYPIYWDGKDKDGQPVLPGVYVCSLFADNTVVKSVKVVKQG